MIIVVDASVALQWVLPETNSEAAIALRSEQLIAPVFWLLEAANALWRRHRRGEFSATQAGTRLLELSEAPVASIAIEPHINAALQLGAQLGHPVYDCLYLAVAIQHHAHVVTADRRFAALADQPGFTDRIRLLGA